MKDSIVQRLNKADSCAKRFKALKSDENANPAELVAAWDDMQHHNKAAATEARASGEDLKADLIEAFSEWIPD